VQAQQDKAAFAASKAVTLASVQGNINTSAKQHVLLTAAGAYLKIQGGDIEIGAPGKAEFKGAQREIAGPQSAEAAQAGLNKAEANPCNFGIQNAAANGDATVPLHA
jgi:uncharacterized protein (DUF2345 family)